MSIKLSRTVRLAAAIALPLTFVAANPFTDGMTYEFQMRTQSTRTGNKEQITMKGRGTYAGDEAKIEILEAGSSTGGQETFGGKGTYFIVKGAGKEMFLVNPKDKQYMKWDIANMFAGMAKMMNAVGGVVKMQMSDVHIDAQDLGPGETIQGYSTHHFRMTQNYTMSASVFGHSSVNKTATTTDYYFAPSLKIANPFVSNSDQMAMASGMDIFNNPDFKTQMMAAQSKIVKNGIPLKTVTTAVSTDAKGKAETTVTTMEMINFTKSNIPSSAFAIPSDYKMIEMPSMNMAGGGSGSGAGAGSSGPSLNVDSIAGAAKQGAKEGVQEGVKTDAKDAAKNAAAGATKKLKGIFKH
jgi:hypothetical protein